MFHDQLCACMRCEAPAPNMWPGGYEMLEYPGEIDDTADRDEYEPGGLYWEED